MFKKLNKKILTTTLALMLSVPAFASVAVSPTRVEINANKLKSNYVTTAIEVKGDSQVPMRFKVYPGYFTINEKSEMVMINNSNGDIHDVSKKVRFVPSEFSVAQGKSQKLRINIANLNQLPDGESRAVLYIEDVNPKEMALPTARSGIGAQLIVKTRVAVPIYIDKGQVTKSAKLENLKVSQEKDGYYSNVKIISNGNSKIRYYGKALILKDKKIIDEYNLTSKVVGNNNYYIAKQKMKIDKLENNQEYTLRIILSYTDQDGKRKNVKEETNFIIQGKV